MPDPAPPRFQSVVVSALTLLMATLTTAALMTSAPTVVAEEAREAEPLTVPDLRRNGLNTRVTVVEVPALEAGIDDQITEMTQAPPLEADAEESPPPVDDTGERDVEAAMTPDGTSPAQEASAPAAIMEQGPMVTLTPPEPLEPPPLKRLEIMLDWYPGPQHAALLIAQHRGIFARHGLQITLTTPADPTLPTRLLAAGRIDLAVSRQPLLHLQVDRGLPLLRVGTLVDLPLAGLLLRDDGIMESPAQLAGRRIGYSMEESRELLLPALLKPHGIALEELDLVDVNFSAVVQMVDEDLDGVMTPQRFALPRQLGDEGVTTRLLALEEHGIPRHEGLILVANRDRLGAQKESLRRLLEALAEAAAWSLEHPEEAWALLAVNEPTLDTPANRDTWLAMLLRLSARPAALDHGGYARFEAFLHERGLLETLTPVGKLAVDLGAP
ncbi:MAG: ABC transporter substrate-binding protein [Halomonas sp.]|uniref:ABC transporter substrate-binding protein n=1 Tax=Halomonas sp. TaxID=1486246 RepID=UPI0019E4F3BC|nr:ABC transporter substrate-binding protein [Halomonas sp.]MBE0487776.1 ABC transporter substrate-binding protein [Halomonas sp.]